MGTRLLFLSVGLVALAGAATGQPREYKYKALACSSARGTTIRIETDVARDAAGQPVTDDVGVARMTYGSLRAEGRFDREGDYYNFRFPNLTVTIDRIGGAAFAYRLPTDPNKEAMVCVPAPLQ